MELYVQDRHEPLVPSTWDPEELENYCQHILAETVKNYSPQTYWPPHKLDVDAGEIPQKGFVDFYYGAAGILWALDYWKYRSDLNVPEEYLKLLLNFDMGKSEKASIFFEEFGFLLFKEHIAPSETNRDQLHKLLEECEGDQKNEILYGIHGTILGTYFLIKETSDKRFLENYNQLKKQIFKSWDFDEEAQCHIWTQNFESCFKFVGAAHGTFGNLQVLLRTKELLTSEEVQLVEQRASLILKNLAYESSECANWPRLVGDPSRMLLHWCHGAPGVICAVADHLPRTQENDDLLRKAGELVWQAGPLKKGTSLCHGTSGNAMAFLKLYKRFQNSLWLDRAKAFSMHCLQQCRDLEQEHGQLRFSLWTGDLGLVWLNEQIKNETADMPMLDVY